VNDHDREDTVRLSNEEKNFFVFTKQYMAKIAEISSRASMIGTSAPTTDQWLTLKIISPSLILS